MAVVLAVSPWLLVLAALSRSRLLPARRDEIIGLIAGMPLLLLGLALLVAGVSVLVDVSIAIMRVRSSPSLQAEVTSLISAALCCERIVALRHSR